MKIILGVGVGVLILVGGWWFMHDRQVMLSEEKTEVMKPSIHPSWDTNNNGINDCEEEGICDDAIDYTEQRPMAEEVGDPLLRAKLMTSASVKFPDTTQTVTLTGETTDTPVGTVIYGPIALPFPYQKDGSHGSQVVTTLSLKGFVYGALFGPGEASWENQRIEVIGENVRITDLKVVGEKVIVVYTTANGQQESKEIFQSQQ